jgi:hypothetical protein
LAAVLAAYNGRIEGERVTEKAITISPGPRLRAAMVVAILADILQLLVFPFVVEGAVSPTDDLIDLAVAAILVALLGWQWEFMPSFVAKVVPAVDMVPFWTLAVANVYRKSKQAVARMEGSGTGDPLRSSQRRS